jgi:hypothetical protein
MTTHIATSSIQINLGKLGRLRRLSLPSKRQGHKVPNGVETDASAQGDRGIRTENLRQMEVPKEVSIHLSPSKVFDEQCRGLLFITLEFPTGNIYSAPLI